MTPQNGNAGRGAGKSNPGDAGARKPVRRGDPPRTGAEPAEPKVVIRDRRRIDPATGNLRQPADGAQQPPARAGSEKPEASQGDTSPTPAVKKSTAGDEPSPADALAAGGSAKPEAGAAAKELEAVQKQLAERTADLQRITAEYANYRRRTERERAAVVEHATALVLTPLLPVLDDIERARSHGDLTGAFGAVAEQLAGALAKLGLAAFGEVGDSFDPTWHEAVLHSVSSDVSVPTCVEIMRKGYALGGKMLRPALVAVAEPGEPDDSDSEPQPLAPGAQSEAEAAPQPETEEA